MPDQQILEYVEKTHGAPVAGYLQRKNIGGAAGSKGVLYENFYAVYHVARMVPYIGNAENDRLKISTQTLNFVDDLIVEDREAAAKRHYQLKNTASVAWGAGKNKICDDFKFQKSVNEAFNVRFTKTTLVVPSVIKANALRRNMPLAISSYSSVEQFGFGDTLSATLQVEPRLFNALAELCVEPEPSKVDRLGTLFIGEWVARLGTACSISDIWEGVKRHEPNYLAYETDTELKPEVDNLLVQIAGFKFRLEKGFFVWQFGDCDSGELSYPVDSKEFQEFQLQLLAREPRNFEELEELLV